MSGDAKGRTIMGAVVSLDGYMAHDDSVGPLFDRYGNGDERAGDKAVAVAAGDVDGQVLAAGLVDEVGMDVVPVVFGSGKPYFRTVDSQHLQEHPDVVIQGDRVLHLRHCVRRES